MIGHIGKLNCYNDHRIYEMLPLNVTIQRRLHVTYPYLLYTCIFHALLQTKILNPPLHKANCNDKATYANLISQLLKHHYDDLHMKQTRLLD